MKKLLLLIAFIAIAGQSFAGEDKGKVVATVNGIDIHENAVEFVYNTIPPQNIQEIGGEAEVKKAIINQLTAAEALKQVALKSGVEKSDTFKKVLSAERERLIQEEYLRVELEKRLTEENLKKAYDGYLSEFQSGMEYNIYNILSKTEKDAKAVIKSLKKGADFQTLAVEKSVATNVNETKGNLGFVKESDLIEDIGKEISSMKVESFSKKPIKSPFGWNVFYLAEKRESKAPTYEEMQEPIKQALAKQEVTIIVNELKENAKIELK